ncbi:lipase family protein (macronuclear) [Tetrahymena thermophila SB210]|uniref:Lipase family protein n=1 Tax=Tetrahymena thermophila (strain SB210) TaxID=312017 RepID=Q237S3_TETTS|nr:lipase family protein [Tetrahymena thermophila SB210]EAR92668.1 lipase family protein [Tetrahymena thermophila SB210]|eukprot:XP_001012913.1 lipase family protein [Tetrahymena thermophila SB210]
MKSIFLLIISLLLASCSQFQYNETLAQDLAGFSLASYCNPKYLQQWNCGSACKKNPNGLTDFSYLYNKTLKASGYIGYSAHHDAIIVVFRGTVPWLIQNWIADLNTIKIQYPFCENCYVHKGFYKQFNQLKSQLIQSFTEIRQKYPSSKIFVTGHSLGAAMSFHSMPIIFELNGNKPIDAFYNYGSPRVGNEAYATWFNLQNFALQYGRINNAADPVPHLPPILFPFQFYHTNHEIFYTSFIEDGNKYEQCLDAEHKLCANSKIIAASVRDHLSYFGWNWATSILTCQ